VVEGEKEYPPYCVPDSLYKYLAVITAVKLKPSILVIDEIENTLHAELLEKLYDIIKHEDVQVVAITHSPVLVDICDLKELVVARKEGGATRLYKLKKPEKVEKVLRELGITPSTRFVRNVDH